jgi:hypothetical protein
VPADVRTALVAATVGLGYVLVNAGALAPTDTVLLDVTAVVVYLALLGLLVRRRPARPVASPARAGSAGTIRGWEDPDRRRSGWGYRIVLLVEIVVGLVGLVLLDHLVDGPRVALAWVTVVVGAHFVGLGAVRHVRILQLLGLLVTLCGAFGLVLSATGATEARVAVTAGVLPGALLLASSYRALRSARGRSVADR